MGAEAPVAVAVAKVVAAVERQNRMPVRALRRAPSPARLEAGGPQVVRQQLEAAQLSTTMVMSVEKVVLAC